MPDGRDHRGARNREIGAIQRYRPAAPRGIRFAKRHPLAGQHVPFQAHGGGQEVDLYTFGFRCLHFLHQARHLLPAAAIEHPHVPGAQPDRGAGAVHGGIAAADHHHFVAQRRRVPAGHALQKLDSRQGVFLALAAEPLCTLRPDGHEHRVVPLAQAGQGEVFTPPLAHTEPRAEPPDGVDLRIQRILRQPVGGDSVAQHAAGERVRVEQRAVMTVSCEIVSRGQPRGPRAHDGYSLPGGWRARRRVVRARSAT